MKIIKRLILAAVGVMALLVAAVAAAILSVDSLAKRGIEAGAGYALGVSTTVKSVNVGLFSGKFSMRGLDVANPPGYKGPHFLSLGEGAVSVSFPTLSQNTVELPALMLGDLDLRLEREGGKANYTVILDNLKKLQDASGGSSPQPKAPAGEGKKFIIRDLSLKRITIHANMLGGAVGEIASVTIPIDEIKLQNVGQVGSGVAGTGVTMGQLASIIVQAVMKAASEKGAGVLPAEILGDLRGGLAGLNGLKDIPMQAVGEAKAVVEKIGGEAQKAVEKGLGEVGKAIENVIPGKKKN